MKVITKSDLELYQKLHQSKLNLVIHIIGSVIFIISNVSFIYCLTVQNYISALYFLSLIIASILLQGIGHRYEPIPFKGFKGPIDFIRIIYLELFIIFPIFLFSSYFKDNWNK